MGAADKFMGGSVFWGWGNNLRDWVFPGWGVIAPCPPSNSPGIEDGSASPCMRTGVRPGEHSGQFFTNLYFLSYEEGVI
jgi:hypothetical protein